MSTRTITKSDARKLSQAFKQLPQAERDAAKAKAFGLTPAQVHLQPVVTCIELAGWTIAADEKPASKSKQAAPSKPAEKPAPVDANGIDAAIRLLQPLADMGVPAVCEAMTLLRQEKRIHRAAPVTKPAEKVAPLVSQPSVRDVDAMTYRDMQKLLASVGVPVVGMKKEDLRDMLTDPAYSELFTDAA